MWGDFSRRGTGRLAGFVVVVGASALLLGCPSYSSMTTAKAVTPGQFEIAVSPGATGLSYSALGGTSSANDGTAVIPNIDFGLRYGFHERFDAAFQISGWGNFGLDAKVNFLDTEYVALALDPGVNSTFISPGGSTAGFVQFQVPLLIDLAPTDWMRFTIGPRYIGVSTFSEGGGSYENFAGGSLGIEFIVSDLVRLQPHAGVATWLDNLDNNAALFFSAGFAVKFRVGEPYEKPAPRQPPSREPPSREPPPGEPPSGEPRRLPQPVPLP